MSPYATKPSVSSAPALLDLPSTPFNYGAVMVRLEMERHILC